MGSIGSFEEGINGADVPTVLLDVVGVVIVLAPAGNYQVHTQRPYGIGRPRIPDDALGMTFQIDIDLEPIVGRLVPEETTVDQVGAVGAPPVHRRWGECHPRFAQAANQVWFSARSNSEPRMVASGSSVMISTELRIAPYCQNLSTALTCIGRDVGVVRAHNCEYSIYRARGADTEQSPKSSS